jgi:hypothetical protein
MTHSDSGAVWEVTFNFRSGTAEEMSRPSTAHSAKSNPDLLKSPSMAMEETGNLSIMQENDDFLRKWSGPALLGPLLPAIFALMTIISGHLVLNTWTGYCGYSLDSMFISLPITLSNQLSLSLLLSFRLCQCSIIYLLSLSPCLCLGFLW